MSIVLRLNDVRLLPGCSAGLDEPTALAAVDCEGHPAEGFEQRIRTGVQALIDDSAPWVIETVWPTAEFVVDAQSVLGRWLVALTVALQQRMGDPVWRGRVVHNRTDRLELALPWRRRPVIESALDGAIRLVEQWSRSEPDEAVVGQVTDRFVASLHSIRAEGQDDRQLGYLKAAAERGIPAEILPGTVQLGWGAGADRMRDGQHGDAGLLAVLAAHDRLLANQLLANAGVPLPEGEAVSDLDAAARAAARIGWPVAVKPVRRDAGAGDTGAGDTDADTVVGIGDPAGLEGAVRAALSTCPRGAIVEQQVEGDRHHLLIVNGALLMAVGQAPPSPGGAGAEMTAAVHPDNRLLAARVARLIGLRIATVDLVTPDITRSWREAGGAVCGVNPRPFPAADGQILEAVFGGRSGRIPTAAVTGIGADAVALVLQRIWLATGTVAGVCTTAEVRVGDDRVSAADLSGPPDGRTLLIDPAVEAAVFVLPGARVRTLGHPCDRYDVAAILDTADDLSAAAEILERARDAVVLDIGALGDQPARTARVIAVDANPSGPGAEHRSRDGEVVTIGERNGRFWLLHIDAGDETPLAPVAALPPGSLRTVLFAAALALAQGIDPASMAAALTAAGEPR